mgnify:CR=1 FL=1
MTFTPAPVPKPARTITGLVLHATDSRWGRASEIRSWHTLPTPKGRGWSHIGYHYVVTNGWPTPGAIHERSALWDGRVEWCLPLDTPGFHVAGENAHTIGVVLVGAELAHFSKDQVTAAARLFAALQALVGAPLSVRGHCETATGQAQGKTCPIVLMDAFRAAVLTAATVPAGARLAWLADIHARGLQ